MSLPTEILNFEKTPFLYESRREEICLGDDSCYPDLCWQTCRLFHIKSLTYEKDFPRQEAFENVIASLNRLPCRLFYYLRGVDYRVEFYVGLVLDSYNRGNALHIGDYADMLTQSFQGNFPGSKLDCVTEAQAAALLSSLQDSRMHYSALLGVPSRNKEREDVAFQGLDRMVNVMTSSPPEDDSYSYHKKNFHFIVVWEPVEEANVHKYETLLQETYKHLSLYSSTSIQRSDQQSQQKTEGSSEGGSSGSSVAKGASSSKTEAYGRDNKNSRNTSTNDSSTTSTGKNWASNRAETISSAQSLSVGNQVQNKPVQDWMKYIDEELIPRVRRGLAKGMFRTAVYVGASNSLDHDLLKNTIISICQGDKPTFTPLYARDLTSPHNEEQSSAARRMVSSFSIRRYPTENLALLLDSRPVLEGWNYLASWLTSSEISMLAGLPQKEVPGLELREQVDFGLNVPRASKGLKIGTVMHEGCELKSHHVWLDRNELNKHTFIAGTTGSGKTTTCIRLLVDAVEQGIPFMVIEPAKTEYRRLLNSNEDFGLIVFTVGNESGVPFRLNPFEFLPSESISSRADLLKACFMASFDMEAAIPNLLEEGLYRSYEQYGWDISSGENRFLDNRLEAWEGDGRFFPTISSYISTVLELVDEKGFDDRLKNDYKGSIRARLDSLRAGSKGLMFDTPRSIDFCELIENNIVLELEDLKSGEDKSFFMGLVLGCMNEALKAKHLKNSKFRHITLVEEAHRLLTRPAPGSSSCRSLGVEMFTDMLAEVRKYGECLIIVDQIPAKLAPEILKNTCTKILHKLFARDDKDAVGDTMALSDKQKNSLSSLLTGETIIFSEGWKKPVAVKIDQVEGLETNDKDVDPEKVKRLGWAYWEKHPEQFCPGLASKRWSPEDLISIRKSGQVLARQLQNFSQQKPSAEFIAMKKKLGNEAGPWLCSLLLRKISWASRCFRDIDQEDSVKKFLSETEKMVQDVLSKDSEEAYVSFLLQLDLKNYGK